MPTCSTRRLAAALPALALVLVLSWAGGAARAATWMEQDLDACLAELQDRSRLVLACTEGCGWCERQKAVVADFCEDHPCPGLDTFLVEDQPERAKALGAHSYPSLYLVVEGEPPAGRLVLGQGFLEPQFLSLALHGACRTLGLLPGNGQ
jgi:hypothetical protein